MAEGEFRIATGVNAPDIDVTHLPSHLRERVLLLWRRHAAAAAVADTAYAAGDKRRAEAADVAAEAAAEELEALLEEIGEEAEPYADVEPEQYVYSDVQEELARLYGNWLWQRSRPAGSSYYAPEGPGPGTPEEATPEALAESGRHVLAGAQMGMGELRADLTDAEIIDAARDSYEARVARTERYRARRPNPRTCRTSERSYPYPCHLRRLPDFSDTSYGNAESDSIEFRIGDMTYTLWIGPEDRRMGTSDFARFQLDRTDEGSPTGYAEDTLLETDSESELMRFIGELWVSHRRGEVARTPNPVYSARQYEIMVAQRADPNREIATIADAAYVFRFTGSNPTVKVPHLGSNTEEAEATMLALAREAMADDIATPGFRVGAHTTRYSHELSYEEYWGEVTQIARTGKAAPGDVKGWLDALLSSSRNKSHPFLTNAERQADVLRHTAHPLTVSRGMYPGQGWTLTGFASLGAAWAMAADVAGSVATPLYRPNPSALVEERLLPAKHVLSHRRTIYPTWTPDGRVRLEYLGEGGCPIASLLLEPPTRRNCQWILRDWNGKVVGRLPRTSQRLSRVLAAADENAGTAA